MMESPRARKILDVYTVRGAAGVLGVSRTWLYHLLKAGELEEVWTRDGFRLVTGRSMGAYVERREQN